MLICAATGNKAKLRELRRIMEARGYEVKSQKELGITLDPEETGTTFAENARIKAAAICAASGLPTLADDSGLAMDALDGAPGVYSARYAGGHGNDDANNEKLLRELSRFPKDQWQGKFVSAVCFYLPNGASLVTQGECCGHVIDEARGENGFGYDPFFVPNEIGLADGSAAPNTEGLTSGEMESWQKDAISHRGAALAQLDAALSDFMAQNDSRSIDITRVDGSLGFERDTKYDGDKVTRNLR